MQVEKKTLKRGERRKTHNCAPSIFEEGCRDPKFVLRRAALELSYECLLIMRGRLLIGDQNLKLKVIITTPTLISLYNIPAVTLQIS